MFAEMFGIELVAAVEASTEKEDKKAEKTSLKEKAIKEVHKDVEIKVDERENPKVPVFLFEISPGFVRPVVLNKSELEFVSDPLKHLLRLAELERKSHENSQKPKVEEEKKAKPEEPKKPATETWQGRKRTVYRCNSSWRIRKNLETDKSTPSRPAESSIPSGSASGQSARESASNREVPEQSNQANRRAPGESVKKSATKQFIESFVADCRFDFNIGTWNSVENEPKQCFVGGAQKDPRSKITDVLNEHTARGNGNAPSRS